MQPSFLRGMRQDIHKKEYKKRNRINSFFQRAGDGNRTHVSSLEGWCSTIELHPHKMYEIEYCRAETVVSALMPSSGIEPETRGFSVLCSTN